VQFDDAEEAGKPESRRAFRWACEGRHERNFGYALSVPRQSERPA